MTQANKQAPWQHQHNFVSLNQQGERNTWYVLLLTVVTMLAEIIAGTLYGSMALLADGWHMGTHAAAFMITLFAYRYASKHQHSNKYAFGAGKVSVLGGFTSAIALGGVGFIMVIESVVRLFNPESIHFQEAIFVALIGLAVNVVSVFLLKDHHSHEHHHDHKHDHHHEHHDSHHEHTHHDHNLRAAYFHVMADALTSILAIAALLMGKYVGLTWLDPIMGIVGALIISKWAWGLLLQTAPILLDKSIEQDYQQQVVECIEQLKDHRVTDLHIWSVSADHYAAELAIVAQKPFPVEYYRQLLQSFTRLDHLTIEVNQDTH